VASHPVLQALVQALVPVSALALASAARRRLERVAHVAATCTTRR
jgi:hypothetical protein